MRDTKNYIIFILATIVGFMTLVVTELIGCNTTYRNDYNELKQSSTDAIKELNVEVKELNNEYDELLKAYNKLQSDYDSLNNSNTNLQKLFKKQSDLLLENKVEVKKEEPKKIENVSVVNEEVVDEPIVNEPQVEEEPNVEPSESGSENGMTYVGSFELTAYESTGNPMANGEYPYYGAVASNYFALGTVIYIENFGTFVVCDRGGMASNVIDIYLGDYDSCIQFGRQCGNVYIVN